MLFLLVDLALIALALAVPPDNENNNRYLEHLTYHSDIDRQFNEFFLPIPPRSLYTDRPRNHLDRANERQIVRDWLFSNEYAPLWRTPVHFMQEQRNLNNFRNTESRPIRPPRNIENLVSDTLVCPQEPGQDDTNECLICRLENTKEKLNCCSQHVHAECLKNWWDRTPENMPIKCLHCQKIIQDVD